MYRIFIYEKIRNDIKYSLRQELNVYLGGRDEDSRFG